VVSEFLKARNLAYSAGSWDAMFKTRIEPAIADSRLAIADLVTLLRSVEEYGQQHIFLYRTAAANVAALLDRTRVTQTLTSLGIAGVLVEPLHFEFPPAPAIVDVRWADNDRTLVIKEVITRESFELTGESMNGDTFQKTYKRVRERGVNILSLTASGDLQIRLNSRRGSSRYTDDLLQFVQRMAAFVPVHAFAIVSLHKAKAKLWTDRKTLASKIRYSDLVVTNDEDVSLRAYGNALDVNVVGNDAAEASVDSFLSSNGYCESSNVWFMKGSVTPVPARDIHVVLNGEANEFAVPANCSEADYEYVLSEIRTLNI
jgi:hypothetical protein